MKFGYEWVSDGKFNLYWDGDKITDDPIDNPQDGKLTDNGIPVGAETAAAEWVAEQSVPDDNKLQDAIEQLAAIQAGNFEERDEDQS